MYSISVVVVVIRLSPYDQLSYSLIFTFINAANQNAFRYIHTDSIFAFYSLHSCGFQKKTPAPIFSRALIEMLKSI